MPLLAFLLSGMALPLYVQGEPDDSSIISPAALDSRLSSQLPGFTFAPQEDDRSSLAPAMLDIGMAVERAVQWHPAIAEAVGSLLMQGEQINVERARYYPQVSGGFQAGYDSAYEGNGFSPSFVLSASQMLYDFGKVSSAVRSAESGMLEQQANVLLSIDQVTYEVGQALLEVQRYQNLLRIADEQAGGLETVADLARDRSAKGASSRSDVVQSEARVSGARSLQLQYQAQLERWRGSLANQLGWPAVMAVSDAFPDAIDDYCAAEPSATQLVPSLLAAQAQRSQAMARLQSARAQSLPTISLDPSLTHYLNDNHTTSNNSDRTRHGIFLNVNMPLYQGGALSAQKRAASHALESADAALRNASLQSRKNLQEARSQTFSLRGNLKVLQNRYALSEQTRDLYYQQYLQLGTRPLLDLLNSEQEIHQSRFDWQNILSDLRQLQLTCLYNSGALRSAFGLDGRRIQGVEVRP
ncbi:TolC family outer membrane protein [Pseudomonas sp. ABC1]|uniref:TolC family outer membrane protein n=1 Tax=Pseudomonas sp. ABC1 TaxID=2748080 RepID=UPI0015C3412C|nr:TolC family outer membrane protein [Pseudomonas sp. ABC1]QLF93150.1 TolC family outer membrane protein [Pseudomonas sp. ABC1]